MSDRFDYDKAEADLYDSGCRYSDEVYEYRNEKDFRSFMREHDLDPDDYRKKDRDSGRGSNGSGEGCFLTSACVEAMGLPDDCRELQTLRAFRDGYLKNRAGGSADIAEYYRTAPEIVRRIREKEDSQKIWARIYRTLVLPCVGFIESGRNEDAYALYKSVSLKLKGQYCC